MFPNYNTILLKIQLKLKHLKQKIQVYNKNLKNQKKDLPILFLIWDRFAIVNLISTQFNHKIVLLNK